MSEMISRDMYKKIKKMNREQVNNFTNNLVDIKLRNRTQAYLDTVNQSLSDSIKGILKSEFSFTDEDWNRFEAIFNGDDNNGTN